MGGGVVDQIGDAAFERARAARNFDRARQVERHLGAAAFGVGGDLAGDGVSGGGDLYQSRVSERANLTTDTVVHDATVRGKWVSPGGYPTRGEKGTVYTLMCVPRNQISGHP